MSDEIRISGIVEESIVDGPGLRYVLFTQGCPHHCPGCHNPQTHDFSGGKEGDTEEILALLGQYEYGVTPEIKVNRWPWRALRLGMTQSNRSTPR